MFQTDVFVPPVYNINIVINMGWILLAERRGRMKGHVLP